MPPPKGSLLPLVVLGGSIAASCATTPRPDDIRPAAAAEIAENALGPVRSFADERHVIVLLPRVPPGTATAAGEALAERHGADLTAVWTLASADETCFVMRLGEGVDAIAASERLEGEAQVLLAYPIQSFRTRRDTPALEASDPSPAAAPIPPGSAEPLLPVQDALRTMRVPSAHTQLTGEGVRVALIDSAVATDHPDLVDRDVRTLDFVGTPASPAEVHGTAMAAIIGADASNGIGMVGVAPDASLLALRGCWEDESGRGRCNTFSLSLALDRAVIEEADVINMGLEGPPDDLVAGLVGIAQERGALVVAASGDTGFPAGLPGVVSVSPSDRPDARETTSGIDAAPRGRVRAPGFEVLSAAPDGGYDFYTGASVAAAHVSGVAALLRSGEPEAPRDSVRAAIDAGGDPLDACAALAALPTGRRCP